jgi:hypothetical protein
MKLKQSLPFFNILISTPYKNRREVLSSLPMFVIDDLIEIVYNIVLGNVKIHKTKIKHLIKNKRVLLKLLNASSSEHRKKILNKQTGGFIGALIPLIASTIASLL